MLHDFTNDASILYVGAYLFWKRAFLVVCVGFVALEEVQVDAGTLARENLGMHAVFAEVDGGAVY